MPAQRFTNGARACVQAALAAFRADKCRALALVLMPIVLMAGLIGTNAHLRSHRLSVRIAASAMEPLARVHQADVLRRASFQAPSLQPAKLYGEVRSVEPPLAVGTSIAAVPARVAESFDPTPPSAAHAAALRSSAYTLRLSRVATLPQPLGSLPPIGTLSDAPSPPSMLATTPHLVRLEAHTAATTAQPRLTAWHGVQLASKALLENVGDFGPAQHAFEHREPAAVAASGLPDAIPPSDSLSVAPETNRALSATLSLSDAFALRLAAAAAAQTLDFVIYDPTYRRIAYPMGDVEPMYGVCTDVVVRAYRKLGVDLQELVQRVRAGTGDPNIDHRRVEVLRRFFSRYAEVLANSDFGEDYQPGDIVTYHRPQNQHSKSHIAVVAADRGPSGNLMIIHNRGWGPQTEDALFVDEITGHFRFSSLPDAVPKVRSVKRQPAGPRLATPASELIQTSFAPLID